jgi:hypothetical protein
MQFLHRNGGPASLGRQSENSDASGATARVRIVPPRGERWQLSVVTLRRPVVSSEVGRRCPSAQNCRPKFCSEHGAATARAHPLLLRPSVVVRTRAAPPIQSTRRRRGCWNPQMARDPPPPPCGVGGEVSLPVGTKPPCQQVTAGPSAWVSPLLCRLLHSRRANSTVARHMRQTCMKTWRRCRGTARPAWPDPAITPSPTMAYNFVP